MRWGQDWGAHPGCPEVGFGDMCRTKVKRKRKPLKRSPRFLIGNFQSLRRSPHFLVLSFARLIFSALPLLIAASFNTRGVF